MKSIENTRRIKGEAKWQVPKRLFGALRCVSKFLRTITVRRSRPSSRSRTVWQLQRGTEIPSPRYPRSWIPFFFSTKLLRFAGIRAETSRKITFFVRTKFVSLPMARADYKRASFKGTLFNTALFHLIRKIHTLYIPRITLFHCEIAVFARKNCGKN